MKRMTFAVAILIFVISAMTALYAQTRTQRVKAQYPLNLVLTTSTLTRTQVVALTACKLVFHLKPGMTNADANAAIDDGYTAFFNCLRNGGKRATPAGS